MRYLLIAVGLVACLAAFAFALVMLGGVLGGAAQDAHLLAHVSPWLLLVYPVYWAACWIGHRYI